MTRSFYNRLHLHPPSSGDANGVFPANSSGPLLPDLVPISPMPPHLRRTLPRYNSQRSLPQNAAPLEHPDWPPYIAPTASVLTPTAIARLGDGSDMGFGLEGPKAASRSVLHNYDSAPRPSTPAARLAEYRRTHSMHKGPSHQRHAHFATESPRAAARTRLGQPPVLHKLQRRGMGLHTDALPPADGAGMNDSVDDTIRHTLHVLQGHEQQAMSDNVQRIGLPNGGPVFHLTTTPMSQFVEHEPQVLDAPQPSTEFALTDPIRPLMRDSMAPAASKPTPKASIAQHVDESVLNAAFKEKYTVEEELGSGGFGFVVGATRKSDNAKVAVKFIWRHKVPKHQWVHDPHYGPIPMEVFVLKIVRHPNIIRFVELFQDERFFYLVMERHGYHWNLEPKEGESVQDSLRTVAEVAKQTVPDDTPALLAPSGVLGGVAPPLQNVPNLKVCTPSDLFECIDKHSYLSEKTSQWIFAQVVEAVYYLSTLGIYHCDIKDENCVIDANFNVKLIDFGSSVITDARKPQPLYSKFFGTMTFASAEILRGQPYRAPSAEVWSLGVLLSILITGNCPFAHPDAAVRGELSTPRGFYSQGAWDVLVSCLTVDVDKRISIADLRTHPWVARAWEGRPRTPISERNPVNDLHND